MLKSFFELEYWRTIMGFILLGVAGMVFVGCLIYYSILDNIEKKKKKKPKK